MGGCDVFKVLTPSIQTVRQKRNRTRSLSYCENGRGIGNSARRGKGDGIQWGGKKRHACDRLFGGRASKTKETEEEEEQDVSLGEDGRPIVQEEGGLEETQK